MKNQNTPSDKNYVTRSFAERWRPLIALIFVIILSIILLFSDTKWKEINPLIEESLGFVACFFAGIGAFGRVWCSLYIEGKKNNKLIQEGPYSMCRNPLYFFSAIGAFGTSLAMETLTIPLIIIIAFAIQYPMVVLREQKRLEFLFGADYKDYKHRVPAFLPRSFRLPEQPENYEMNPKKFTRRIIDALWFIWAIGIIEIIDGLHQVGYLPVLFTLY